MKLRLLDGVEKSYSKLCQSFLQVPIGVATTSKGMFRRIARIALCLPVLILAQGQISRGQNVGVQAIGLEKFTAMDADILAGQLASVPRKTELAVLPFEFNGPSFAGTKAIGFDDPVFARTKRVATYTLANNPNRFTLTLHLYFSHTGDRLPPFRYSALRRTPSGGYQNNSGKDVAFREELSARALRTAAFLNDLWRWANNQGIVSRLRLVTVPELEDSASVSDWMFAERFVRETYLSVGAITEFRRSVHGGDRNRPNGFGVEKHGDVNAINSLASGDVYSNDGLDIDLSGVPSNSTTKIAFPVFLQRAASATRQGRTVLYWKGSFNGYGLRHISPHLRPALTPFTHPHYGAREQEALWSFLNRY